MIERRCTPVFWALAIAPLFVAAACVEAPAATTRHIDFRASGARAGTGDYAPGGSKAPTSSPIASPTTAPSSTGLPKGGATVATAGAGGSQRLPVSMPPLTGSGGRTGGGIGGSSGLPPVGGAPAIGGMTMGTTTDPTSAPSVGPTDGTLSVAFTTVDQRGRYSPRNCGAVWIETKSSQFVKTTERWCGIRAYYLQRWTKASGGWGGGFGFPTMTMGTSGNAGNDQMDAISMATLRSHVMHQSTWSGHNAKGELVPDGDYKVVIETSDGMSHSTEFAFVKGPTPMQLTPADATPTMGVKIDFKPKGAP